MSLPSGPLDTILVALRAYLKLKLASEQVVVGGWAEIPGRDTVLNVYAHQGKLHKKNHFLFWETAVLELNLTFRSGTAMGDAEVLKLRDALVHLTSRFGHELMAGLEISAWDFNYGKLNTNQFENILSLQGQITTVSTSQSTDEEDVIATITEILFLPPSQQEI